MQVKFSLKKLKEYQDLIRVKTVLNMIFKNLISEALN